MTAATAQRIDVVDADPIEEQPQPTQAVALQQPQQIAAPAGRQLSVVEYAMQNGASAADVRALVELQIQMDNHKLAMLKQQDERDREERNRLAVLAFRRDFAAFRGENIVIPKSKEVDRGKAGSFMQAEYDQVCSRLSVALSRHGFSFRHDQKFGLKKIEGADGAEPWVWVTCFLEHREGHRETLDLEGPPGDLSANTPVQNMQATTSYLKRQSLLAITGTATGGEDDESAMRRKSASGDGKAIDEDLLDEARTKSLEGWKALQKWWEALDAKKRESIMGEFKSLKDAAIKADGGARGGQ